MSRVESPKRKTNKVPPIKAAAQNPDFAGLDVEAWPIERAKPYAQNPRKIGDDAIEAVVASLARYGWRQPVVVCAKEEIVVGHTRRLAAMRIRERGLQIPGWEDTSTIPVHPSGMDEDEARAYRIADNRTGEFAQWDDHVLQAEFGLLESAGFDLSLTGFDAASLDAVGAGAGGQAQVPNAEGEEAGSFLAAADTVFADPETSVEPGQTWRLGKHVLVIACPMQEWGAFVPLLNDGAVLAIYPGLYLPFSIRADKSRLVMVQPDLWTAGHIIDRWRLAGNPVEGPL